MGAGGKRSRGVGGLAVLPRSGAGAAEVFRAGRAAGPVCSGQEVESGSGCAAASEGGELRVRVQPRGPDMRVRGGEYGNEMT